MLLFPNASSLYTQHISESNGRGLSPALWRHMTTGAASPDGTGGHIWFGDDFTNHGKIAAAGDDVSGGYGAYIDTGNTINAVNSESGGVIAFLTDTTDNDECWLTTGGNTGVLGKISDTAGDDKLTIFEARVRFTQVGETYNAFVGLAEQGLAAGDTISDGGAIADKDYIGFHVKESDGNSLLFAYNKQGGTDQTVVTTAISAATWYKLGFVYDPMQPAAKRITAYIDNVEQSTYITAANIATSNFPDGEQLALLGGIKNAGGAANQLDMDWWAFYQSA